MERVKTKKCDLSILQYCFVAVLYGYTAAAIGADEWPIIFTNLSISQDAYNDRGIKDIWGDCQPELFDPQKAKYHHSNNGDYYELEGKDADEGIAMNIYSGIGSRSQVEQLPAPLSLVQYSFSCASETSKVFEIKNNGVRHALYTHIESAIFSPDRKRMVLFNYLKSPSGLWQRNRRIIEIETKRLAALPVINETSYIADVSNNAVVTYSGPMDHPKTENGRRIVVIWGNDGKLIRAMSAPLQTTAANAESSDDGIGLLPNEPTTFYHLTRTGQGQCSLRLQDINNQKEHRTINLAVPGLPTDPVAVDMLVQINLEGLSLKTGAIKYRVAASGRGDVVGDWGQWITAK